MMAAPTTATMANAATTSRVGCLASTSIASQIAAPYHVAVVATSAWNDAEIAPVAIAASMLRVANASSEIVGARAAAAIRLATYVNGTTASRTTRRASASGH